MKNSNHNEISSDNVRVGSLGVRRKYMCNLLVSVIAQISSDISSPTESKDKSDDETALVQGVLEEAFGDFAHCDLIDFFTENGVRSSSAGGWKPERFESLNVIAEVWATIRIILPFDPTCKLSLSQQRFIHRNATDMISGIIGSEFDAEVSDAGIWLADCLGKPTKFLTGMLDVLEGRLSERKLERTTAKAWKAIPNHLLQSSKIE